MRNTGLYAVFAAAVVVVTGITGFAQTYDAAPGQGRLPNLSAEDRIRHMSAVLKLTADQQARLRPILQDYEKENAAINNAPALSQQEKASRRRKSREAKDAKIAQLLNPEQRAAFERSRKIREKMGIE